MLKSTLVRILDFFNNIKGLLQVFLDKKSKNIIAEILLNKCNINLYCC